MKTQTIDDEHRNILAFHHDNNNNHDVNNLRVILSTHLDTVPPITRQSSGKDKDKDNDNDEKEEEAWFDEVTQRLYGRGSVDAKGQAASMMITMSDILSSSSLAKRHVGLLLLCSEEHGHIGISAAKHLNLSTDITLINGEPTDSMFASRQKGMISATVSVTGRAAHSGYPHLGVNAIDTLMHLLTRLQHETTTSKNLSDDDSVTTMNVGIVSGGSAPNIIAPHASAVVVWRLGVTTTVVMMKQISTIASEVEALFINNNGTETTKENMITISVTFDKVNDPINLFVPPCMAVRQNVTTVAYNTDIPYYGRDTRFNVLFGAGSIHQAHSVNEYIDVGQLRELPGLYRTLTDEMLALYEHDKGIGDGMCNDDDGGVSKTTEEEEKEEDDNNEVVDDDDDDDDIVDSGHDEI